MVLSIDLHDFAMQSPCLCPAICRILFKGSKMLASLTRHNVYQEYWRLFCRFLLKGSKCPQLKL